MTPHKETAKEPIGKMILWPTLKTQWEVNSTYQLTFTIINLGSPLYQQLDVESSLVLDGQEYVVKNCVENFDTRTKEITAWHVYNEIKRIYQRNQVEDEKTYSIEDVLKYWLDGNNLGFSYEIHGNFDKQQIQGLGNGSGKDMLSKIVETWPNAVIFPDNKKIRVYTEDEFYKASGRMLSFPKDAKSIKTTRDSSSIINQIRCIGGKHEVSHTVYTGTGGANASGPTEPVNGDWTPVIQYVASLYNQKLTDAQLNLVRAQINLESSGREDAHGGDDGLADGIAKGLMQFKQRTFDYYAREPYTNVWKGFDTLVACFNIPNFLGQINGVTGWSPTGAPLTKAKLVITPPNSWGWPFPSVGEGTFFTAQKFGFTGGDRTNGFHDGLDFGSIDHPGREVHAVHGGKVQTISYMGGLKNYVTIVSNDYMIVYQEAFSSQSNIIVHVGDTVKTGQVIGYRDTDHLHIGITKQKDINVAERSAFTNDGTWLDPLQIIKNGIAGNDTSDTVGSDTATQTSEEYYFQPFLVTDEKSVAEWGLQPGPDLVDERFHDAESMRKYALTTLKPDPTLTIEVSLKGNKFVPKQGEILKIISQTDYSGDFKTVGYTYPAAVNQDTELTLNNAKTTILDYQNQQSRRIQKAIDEQKKQLEGVVSNLDEQSKALTQITNKQNQTDKDISNLKDQDYWQNNGKQNLVTELTGGKLTNESYEGSPIYEASQNAISSNFFSVDGGSTVSMRLSANATGSLMYGTTTYVIFYGIGGKEISRSTANYVVEDGKWHSIGDAGIYVPTNALIGKLAVETSGDVKVAGVQVNPGYRITTMPLTTSSQSESTSDSQATSAPQSTSQPASQSASGNTTPSQSTAQPASQSDNQSSSDSVASSQGSAQSATQSASQSSSASQPASQPITVSFIKGGNISPSGGMDPAETDKEASDMKLNSVTASLLVRADNASSSDPVVLDDDWNNMTKDVDYLVAKGYKVIIQPYPWIASGSVVETAWDPSDFNGFMTAYKAIILRMAKYAESAGAWGIYIGTNLIKMESHEADWINLIKAVREVYHGKIIYRTNWWYDATWDATTTQNYQTTLGRSFWQYVDIIGVASYFELTDKLNPTSEDLQTALHKVPYYNRGQDIFSEVKAFADKWGKPILFGELGVPPFASGAQQPWDDVTGKDNLDYSVPANLFDAYYKVFGGQSWWLGYSIFTIDDSHSWYNPYGHPAADVIRNQFS